MHTQYLPYSDTKAFSKIVTDYLSENTRLNPFYNLYPKIENFKTLLNSKLFEHVNRTTLHLELLKQYQGFKPFSEVNNNINQLPNLNTFTITTGHQLCIFGGPLYVIYKIISIINLAKQLKKYYPEYHFIPVFWLAAEDHDLEEINHIHIKNQQLKWQTSQTGAVGNFSTQGLLDIAAQIKSIFQGNKNIQNIVTIFEQAYQQKDLSSATRFWLHEIFGKDGLIIIDANTKKFKQQFVPVFEKDILQQSLYSLIQSTNQKLKLLNYNVQANPRNINSFYMNEHQRERIVFDGTYFKTDTLLKNITPEAMQVLIEEQPENFSPNVLLRPLYQQMLLPNIAYIGGGAELAYWLELKQVFDNFQLPYPILLLRNSVLWINKKTAIKIQKLKLNSQELFWQEEQIIKKLAKNKLNQTINFEKLKKKLTTPLLKILPHLQQISPTLDYSTKAVQTKIEKNLQQLESKTTKAIKQQMELEKQAIKSIKEQTHPQNILQERYTNFLTIYAEHGDKFFTTLKQALNPFNFDFTIITTDD